MLVVISAGFDRQRDRRCGGLITTGTLTVIGPAATTMGGLSATVSMVPSVRQLARNTPPNARPPSTNAQNASNGEHGRVRGL